MKRSEKSRLRAAVACKTSDLFKSSIFSKHSGVRQAFFEVVTLEEHVRKVERLWAGNTEFKTQRGRDVCFQKYPFTVAVALARRWILPLAVLKGT